MTVLSDLLDLPLHPLISIVGAGGKTTTMYTLASELAQHGNRVITTTTTNICFPKQDETDTLIVATETPALLKMVSAAWKQHHRVTVAGRAIGSGKIAGLQPDQPYELLMKSGADVVIVEADGARHKMIKAPAEHEPVVPPQTNVALLMMSAEAINQPLSGEIAHRPERVAAVLGINQGDLLTPALVARLMMSEEGGMKDIPEMAKVYLLITRVMEGRGDEVREVAELVGRSARAASVYCSNRQGDWFVI
ncbi:MAG TPA: selenium cofactor biosynthesis protein YqeC [Ktedonobacteraceae bacterium]|nr:selenium cofactor biosynthesis protein YqeC [Ktedonobacteraceae bacterium]